MSLVTLGCTVFNLRLRKISQHEIPKCESILFGILKNTLKLAGIGRPFGRQGIFTGVQAPTRQDSDWYTPHNFQQPLVISYSIMSQRSFGLHGHTSLPPVDGDGAFRQKTDNFMDWFRVQTGTIINPKLELVDLRSRGAGRAISTYTTLISSAPHDFNKTED